MTAFGEYKDKVLSDLNTKKEDILSNMARAMTFDENGYISSEVYIVKSNITERHPCKGTLLDYTAKIIAAFRKGFQDDNNTIEVWYLSDRTQWGKAKNAFQNNKDILFALPLYVENVSGIMLEFLENLSPKTDSGTRLSFLLQGGFPEASQSRCCENFLKTLPHKLGCEYGGTFIRGDMFGIGLLGDKLRAKMVQPFVEIGRLFAQYGYFDAEIISRFASPEYLSAKQIRQSEGFGKYLQKWAMDWVTKRLGCKDKLDAKSYT